MAQLHTVWTAADATIQAARVQAEATRAAAVTQGWFIVAAATLALLGGILAYFGAIRQVRLSERQHAARVAAYRFRVRMLLNDLTVKAAVAFAAAQDALVVHRECGGSYRIQLSPLPEMRDFSAEYWQDHALLSESAVRAIYAVDDALCMYLAFKGEVEKDDLKCDDITSEQVNFRPPIHEADGSVTMVQETVVEQNVSLLTALKEAIDGLQAAVS